MMDQKNSGIVGSFLNAHDDVIRDIQWNPFVPHWLASAGEDSVVNVW